MTHPHYRPDQLRPDELDRLPSVDVSGTDRLYLGPLPDDADGWVTVLGADADALNKALAGYAPEDWREAARLLNRLRSAVAVLRALDASLVQWLYLHGEHGKQVVDGVGEVWITRGRAKERWAAPEAVKAYVERRLTETGEVPDPLEVVAWVLDVLPATQSSSLRKTPLRQVGIDLDDFYWSEPGSLQVNLPPPDPASTT